MEGQISRSAYCIHTKGNEKLNETFKERKGANEADKKEN